MSDHLPVTLANLHGDAKTASDRIETFRAYVKLLNHAYRALERAREEAVTADRRLAELRVDHTFFLRQRARIEAAFKALIDTYRNPTKAMRTIEELAANYPAKYVFEVCQLGSYRLGTPLGWNLLGVRSASRIDADQNYADAVIPALAKMLPDHAGYLDLRARDVEATFGGALADANHKRAVQAAVEAALPGWGDELAACGRALKTEEVARLTNGEREVLRRMMPPPTVEPPPE